MTLSLMQLVFLLGYVLALGGAVWAAKRKIAWLFAVLLSIMFVASFYSPIRFKQENMSAIENSGFSATQAELPERVTVEKEDYDSRAKRIYNELKQKNEETQNEINQ